MADGGEEYVEYLVRVCRPTVQECDGDCGGLVDAAPEQDFAVVLGSGQPFDPESAGFQVDGDVRAVVQDDMEVAPDRFVTKRDDGGDGSAFLSTAGFP